MKLGSRPDYFVQVFRADDDPAEWYEDVFTVKLNGPLTITFVPYVDQDPPPWPADRDGPLDRPASPNEARWLELVTSGYGVTPSTDRASRIEQVGPPDLRSTIFYVTPAEFDRFLPELHELAEQTDDVVSSPTRAQVLDRAVVRFIDETILDSPHLRWHHADLVGRPRPAND